MNQRRFTNVIFVVGTMILVGAAGHFVLNRQAAAQESARSPICKLSPTELKYRLREKFNDKIHFCGPAVVVSSIEAKKRFKQFSVIAQKEEEFLTILRHNNLSVTGPWSDRDKQIVVQEYNILSAIRLDPVEKKYKFRLLVPMMFKTDTNGVKEEPAGQSRPQLPKNMLLIGGFIDQDGIINISKKEPIFHTCPR